MHGRRQDGNMGEKKTKDSQILIPSPSREIISEEMSELFKLVSNTMRITEPDELSLSLSMQVERVRFEHNAAIFLPS